MKYLILHLLLFGQIIGLAAQSYLDHSNLIPTPFSQRQSMDVAAADLNQDGFIDLVMANEFQVNTILLGSSDGSFIHSPQTAMNVVNDSEDVIIADFNLDGWLDIIFCSEDDYVNGETNVHEYYLGSATGTFSKAAFQLPDSEANAVITLDINNDNWPDVLLGNNGPITCLINEGNGNFDDQSNRFPTANKTTQDLHAFDADGDEDLDIFEANENGNILFINDGSGNFSMASNALPVTNLETRKIASGDIDKDGDMDLFLCNVAFNSNNDKQNRLWQNDGYGQFIDITSTHLPFDNDQTLDVVLGDLDYDDDLDLILGNVFGGASKIYINQNGSFTESSTTIFPQPYFLDALTVMFTDLNQDGFKDILLGDRTMGSDGSKDVLLLYDIGSGTFTSSPKMQVDLFPNPVDSILRINSPENNFDQIIIRDSQGKKVLNQRTSGVKQTYTINLSHLPTSQYNLSLYIGNKLLYTAPLIKL